MSDEPNEIIERADMLIEETARVRTKPLDDSVDPIAREHRETIRREAKTDDTGG